MYLATEQAASHITHGKMENPDGFSSNHFPLQWTIGGKVIDSFEVISELKQLDVKKTSWDLIHGALKESIKEINILQNYPRNHKKSTEQQLDSKKPQKKSTPLLRITPKLKRYWTKDLENECFKLVLLKRKARLSQEQPDIELARKAQKQFQDNAYKARDKIWNDFIGPSKRLTHGKFGNG